MITNFKIFENINNNNIMRGDYVLIKTNDDHIVKDKEIEKAKKFIDTSIGRCKYFYSENNITKILVEYLNVPTEIKSYFRQFGDSDIELGKYYRTFDINRVVEYGKTPEELEMKINSKKYNI